MDLYELSKQLGNDIIIKYNCKTDEFTAELDDVCTIDQTMVDALGIGKCRKDALRDLIEVIRGKDLYGSLDVIKVPDDITIPSGL